MPFDGLVVKSITKELKTKLIGGRIEKIYQPERDELIFSVWTRDGSYKLLLSSSPNHPRIHLTETEKENPLAPPAFCMLLRKHLNSGKIVDIGFYDYERIISLHIESYNTLGDLTVKQLIIEIMGKHSNIILINEDGKIIDAIKRITSEISSKRVVLPGIDYSMPPAQNKTSPEELDPEVFFKDFANSNKGIARFLLDNIKGFSPTVCSEICASADLEKNLPVSELAPDQIERLKSNIISYLQALRYNEFTPCVFYDKDNDKPIDFHCFKLSLFNKAKCFDSISKAADTYYFEKDLFDRVGQKKASIVKVINNNLERCLRKKAIQEESLRESSNRDLFRLYGELILANIYNIKPNSKKITVINYYSPENEHIDIPLNPNKTAQQNAQLYFKKYNKAKSTFNHVSKLIKETIHEIEYLESVQLMLDNCYSYSEVEDIRGELSEQGYISKRKQKRKIRKETPSKPHHFVSSDGFDIFVGKNNKQNDYLTLRLSKPGDLWLHVQKMPGSHVIVRTNNSHVPDSTLLEASTLAAYYSKARFSINVPVDYTEVKNVKKPNGAKPGMVIYENYKTIFITPDKNKIDHLHLVG